MADWSLAYENEMEQTFAALVAAAAATPPAVLSVVCAVCGDAARASVTPTDTRSESEFQYVRSALAWCVGNLEQDGVKLPRDVLRALEDSLAARVAVPLDQKDATDE